MSFGKRVKQLREERGLSRNELAKSLNITYAALSKYETDDRFPSEDILSRIADYFEVSVDNLIGRNCTQHINRINGSKEELEKHIEIAKEINELDEDDRRFILEMIQKLKKNQKDK